MQKKIILTLGTLFLLMSCVNLEEQVYSSLTPEVYFNNAQDAQVALMGVYNTLNRQHIYTNDLFVMVTLPTKYMNTRLETHKSYVSFNFATTDPRIYRVWQSFYLTINRANTIIERVPSIEIPDAPKNEFVAEAKFLRAQTYFYLVRLFGGVPLKLSETKGINAINTPRATADEVYEVIIQDLKFAIENLPAQREVTQRGRATCGAAKSLLGKVYLTMAGYPLKQTDKLQLAHTELKNIIDNKSTYNIDLMGNFADLFDIKKEAVNNEIIFSIQFSHEVDQGSALAFFAAPLNSNFATSRGQYNYGFTREFRELFQDGDSRKNVTSVWQYTAFNGATVTFNSSTYYRDPFGVALGKYQDGPNTARSNVAHANDIMLLRYADVLLMFAEVENELNGPTVDAVNALNEIRERAKAELLQLPLTLDKNEFREKVYVERLKELSGELHEYFDIQRLGLLKDHMENSFEVKLAKVDYNESAYLYPIPDNEMVMNKSIGQENQNPGY